MKKRLMAFLLAVVTTVGSLPTAPVFAAEDVEEVVVEDAGEVTVSAGKIDTVKIVSKNGADYTSENLNDKTVKVSANETLTISVNFSSKDNEIDAEGYAYKVKAASSKATVATVTAEKELISADGALYADGIDIKGVDNGTSDVTFEVVSSNGASIAKIGKVSVEVVKAAEEQNEDPKTPSENKSESENKAEEEVIDYEALAEAQKDAEGMTAFTQIIDIDPDATYQEFDMVVKQSFTDAALAGFTYSDKKAEKKLLSISKKGKVSAKKTGKVVLRKAEKVISINIVKPAMPKKVSVEGGKPVDIKISGLESTSLNVVFVSSDPAKAAVSYNSAERTAWVTGNVKGSVTVTAYVNGKTYKTKVKVTSNAAKADYTEYKAFFNVGTSKNLKAPSGVKGVKYWEIVSANGAKSEFKSAKNPKKFIAGDVAGCVTVNGKNKEGKVLVSGNIIVQDLKLSLGKDKSASVNGIDVNAGKELVEKKVYRNNKADTYEINIKLDQKEGIKGGVKKGYAKVVFANYAQEQPVVFKSSKAANVYMNGNGVIVAKKAYKKAVTLTGKVNGKTIKIKVKVTEA
ncbi:MAG: hypothetical protein K5686_07245 [Lachnospiraceae bacterium]|nr:hypothetical protein [Lachnospiraceae bacterium]